MFLPNQYNKREQNHQEVRETGIFGTIAKTALMFVVYGVGMKVATSIGFKANVGLGKLVTKLTSKGSNVGKAIDGAVRGVRSAAHGTAGKKAVGKFGTFLQRGRKSIQESLRSIKTTLSDDVIRPYINEGRYSSRVSRYGNKVQANAVKAVQNRTMPGSILTKNTQQVKDIRLTSIIANTKKFKNSKFGQAIHKLNKDLSFARKHKKTGLVDILRNSEKLSSRDLHSVAKGRLYNYGTFLASTAAFDYGMYNVMMDDNRKWTNPGKIADWAMFTVGFDVAIRGAIPNAKAGAKYLGKAVRRGMKYKDTGKKFVKSVLSRAQTIANMSVPRAAAEAVKNVKGLTNETKGTGKEFIRRIQSFNKQFRKAKIRFDKESRSEIINNQNKDWVKTTIENAKANELLANDKDLKNVVVKTARAALDKQAGKNDPNKWRNVVNRIFNTDIQSAKATNASNSVYKGHGHIQMGKDEYNLSAIMPKNLLSNAFTMLQNNFTIGISKKIRFSPLSIFGRKPVAEGIDNKFSLYTSSGPKQSVSIGPGYDPVRIDARLDAIKSKRTPLLENELLSSVDGQNVKTIKDSYKLFKKGKLKNASPELNGRMESLAALDVERSNLEEALDFSNTYLNKRQKLSNANKQPHAKDIYTEKLARGEIRIEDKNEFVMSVGNTMYYGAKDGKQWKTWQLGYDLDKGTRHALLNIPGKAAGGWMGLSQASRKNNDVIENSIFGTKSNNTVSRMSPKSSRYVPDDASNIRKVGARVAEALDIGPKEQRSIFGTIKSFFTKAFNPREYRTMVDQIEAGPNKYLHQLRQSTEDLHTVGNRLTTVHNNIDVKMTDKVTKHANFIDEMGSEVKKKHHHLKGLDNEFEMFKNGDIIFISDKTLGNVDDAAAQIRSTAKNLKEARAGINRASLDTIDTRFEVSDSDAAFLDVIIGHRDPVKFLGSVADRSNGLLKNREVYNNLTARTFFSGMSTSSANQVIRRVSAAPKLTSMKNDIMALQTSQMVNTYKTVNVNSLARMDNDLDMVLAEHTVGFMKKHKKAVNRTVDMIEPAMGPSSTRSDMMYPGQQDVPVNLVLSTNKDTSGVQIYDFGEQFSRTVKMNDGTKRGTVQTVSNMRTSAALSAVNNTANIIGLGFSHGAEDTVGEFGKRLAFKRILPAMALATTYNASDAFLDESGLFEGTALGEGLDPLMANVIGQTRLAIAGVNDAVGVTATAKYLEDIMPGSVNSPLAHTVRGLGGPIAGMGLGTKFGGPMGGLVGGAIGAAVSIMSSGGPLGALGKFDISKSREQLIEEYAGRRKTPIYKGSGWMFSTSAVAGSKISRWESSWFHQMTSQYKNTEVLYGSKTERMLSMFDTDHYFEKHQVTRPFPVTENALSHTPLVGNMIGFGGQMANEQEMKYAAMSESMGSTGLNLGGVVGANKNLGIPGDAIAGSNVVKGSAYSDITNMQLGNSSTYSPSAVMQNSAPGRIQEGLTQMSDLMGLRGFITESVITANSGGLMPYETVPKLESASYMTSPYRAYWDKNMGGMLGTNELIRRFMPRRKQNTNIVNPIKNNMPTWITNANNFIDLGKGDPFSKIDKGELRLPGAGYSTVNKVNYSVPLETSFLGRPIEEQIGIFTGNYIENEDERLERYMKPTIQDAVVQQLSAANEQVHKNRSNFITMSNMSSNLDVLSGGKGIDIHVVGSDTFSRIGGKALPHHEAQLNADLIMSGLKVGEVLYYNADTGQTKTTRVIANTGKFRQDVGVLTSAQSASASAINRLGPSAGMNLANAYSRLDRLAILGDVAPYSEEYKKTLGQVKKQLAANMLTEREQTKLQDIQTMRGEVAGRYLLNDYKFNRGTAVTEQESNYQNYVEGSYSGAEKLVGSLWESFSHAESPFHSKLMANQSALEAYERKEIYGKPMRDWNEPYRDFVRPFTTSALERNTTGSGAMAFGTAGMVFGGPVAMAGAAVFGAAYGTVNPERGIPGWRQEERDVAGQMDAIRYQKASDLYNASGSLDAKAEMERTLTYQYNNATTPRAMFSAMPYHERGVARSFANAGTLEERQRIMQVVPDYIKPALESSWSGSQGDLSTGQELMESYDTPNANWKGWNAELESDDIAVKMYERAGIDAHGAGLGWQDQVRKMAYTPGLPNSFTDPMETQTNQAQLATSIIQSLIPGARVNAVPSNMKGIRVTIT